MITDPFRAAFIEGLQDAHDYSCAPDDEEGRAAIKAAIKALERLHLDNSRLTKDKEDLLRVMKAQADLLEENRQRIESQQLRILHTTLRQREIEERKQIAADHLLDKMEVRHEK